MSTVKLLKIMHIIRFLIIMRQAKRLTVMAIILRAAPGNKQANWLGVALYKYQARTQLATWARHQTSQWGTTQYLSIPLIFLAPCSPSSHHLMVMAFIMLITIHQEVLSLAMQIQAAASAPPYVFLLKVVTLQLQYFFLFQTNV